MKRRDLLLPLTAILLAIIMMLFFATELNAQNKEEFKPSSKLWGLAFGDFYYKLNADSAHNWGETEYAKVKKDFIGMSVRRLYVGCDFNLAPHFAAHTIFESNDVALTTGGERAVIIKAANLEWKNIFPRHTLVIGQSGTPCFSLSEKIWGYRSVEKMIGDQRKIQPSNDFGLKLEGRIDTTKNFGYTIMYASGKSTKPEDNRLKKYYAGIDGKFLNNKILFALNADYEDQEVALNKKPKSKTTIEAFITYTYEKFTVGLEGVYQFQKNYKIFDPTVADTNSTLPKDSTDMYAMGLSVFAKGIIIKDVLTAFARYDLYTPDFYYVKGDNIAKPYQESFLTAGLDYSPNKNVHIIPNIWFNAYTDMREKPAVYDITTDYLAYYDRKPDVVARITFYYVFK